MTEVLVSNTTNVLVPSYTKGTLLLFIIYLYLFKLGETLKSSKSVGDLMIEIQKETENMTLDREDNTQGRNSKATVIRKSRAYSQTPPPSKGQANKDQRIR